ncbi:MAG: NADH-quinone oxidoreductase subunit H [Planctomycetes bacterium]|nr:NADH-quinone oxidoreductase subunit H [Planctomycetota bacterium]
MDILHWITSHPYQTAGLILPIAIPLILFQVLPLLVLLERRGAAFIQDRVGPSRAYIPLPGLRIRAFGMLYNATDLIKLLFKENFVPPFAYKSFYWLAPAIPVATGLLTPALLPWFSPILYQDGAGVSSLTGTLITTSSGLLLLFALGSLSVYGVVLGSWSSNSKFSLLGGMRASAMMISYEVSMGLSVLGLLLIVGSFNLTDIVEWQGHHTWGMFVQPIGFLLFLVSMFAECNRNPFDVAEGESEIVGGFHTEYAGVKFMMFMTGEYLHVLVASALLATLYAGGYELLPFPVPMLADTSGFVPFLTTVFRPESYLSLDTLWVKAHLGGVVAIMLGITAVLVFVFATLIAGRRRNYAQQDAQDRDMRLREYGIYCSAFTGLGVMLLLGAIACGLFMTTQPLVAAGTLSPQPIYPGWVNAVTAVLQFHIVIGKTLAFAWLFIWVRWTLPRFRYDQIMGLGWKVMLNIALVNLLITAIVAKAIGGGR